MQVDSLGLSRSLAEYLVSIINTSSTFGRILPAYLGDRFDVSNVMTPMTLLGGIFALALWLLYAPSR
ncbi:hypothetical protein NW764_016563 [Fusarium oxysporum]|nr:hypothetical protein NW764_016563 [Fusarium oxysporum]